MEKFSREHSDYGYDHLACLCAISSYFLVMVGRQFGYHLTLVEGLAFDEDIEDLLWDEELDPPSSNHCWVEYKGKIIDITATQFDDSVKKVHIVDDTSENYWWITRHNLARQALKRSWPTNQSPYAYIKELRKGVARVKTKLAA
jgi:hypothetical protein